MNDNITQHGSLLDNNPQSKTTEPDSAATGHAHLDEGTARQHRLIACCLQYPKAFNVAAGLSPQRLLSTHFADEICAAIYGAAYVVRDRQHDPSYENVQAELERWSDEQINPRQHIAVRAMQEMAEIILCYTCQSEQQAKAMVAELASQIMTDHATYQDRVAPIVEAHDATDHIKGESRVDQDGQAEQTEQSVFNAFQSLTAYPAPLRKAAMHGLAGDIVRAIEPHSESDPAALHFQFLAAFGNVIGRHAHFAVEADKHYMNLFIVLVGLSSTGRKGTSWGHILRLFQAVDEEWTKNRILSGLSSGEGVIWAVRDPILREERVKDQDTGDTEFETTVIDRGVEDKRLLVMESELATPLKGMAREGNTLSPIIRQAWDTGNLRTLTKNSPTQSTSAHISINGHITQMELLKLLKGSETSNGFANRFLFVCVTKSKSLAEGGRINEVNLAPLILRLKQAVDFARRADELFGGELRRDAAARNLWIQVYPQLSEGAPGLLGAVTGRAEAQVMRVACIYALLDCSTVIRREHLEGALAAWEYAAASAAFIFGDSLGDPVADALLHELRTRYPEGMTGTEIQDYFKRNHPSRTKAALSHLLQLNLVRQEKQTPDKQTRERGRPATVWFANPPQGTSSTSYDKNDKNDLNAKSPGSTPNSVVNIVSFAGVSDVIEKEAISPDDDDEVVI